MEVCNTVYPKLVRFARTPVSVTLVASEPNSFGERESLIMSGLYCNWQESAGVVYTSDKQKTATAGVALFDGDICPAWQVISGGAIEVCGVKRTIVRGQKCRNPDGSVNYTRLDVI